MALSLVSLFYFLIIIFHLLYEGRHTHATTHVEIRRQLVGVSSQVIRLDIKCLSPLSHLVSTCLVKSFPMADFALHTFSEMDQIGEYSYTLSKGCVTFPGEMCKNIHSYQIVH